MRSMSIFARVPFLRWAVPASVAVVIIGGGAALGGITATAAGTLPARSAAQLVSDVAQASLVGLSGTVVQTSDLGFPSVPGVGGTDSSSLSSLISGTHTLRLWYAAPDKARLALLGKLGESDVIRNGPDLWTWSSRDNTVTHQKTTERSAETFPPLTTELPGAAATTPAAAAAAALKAIGPSTVVTTNGNATVAGRSAYELVLRPRDTRSLIAQVRIAIDATEHVPLRVEVLASGQADPAFLVAFSSVDFTRPDDAEFAFTPPPGAGVTEDVAAPTGMAGSAPDIAGAAGTATKVVGSGWTSVLVADVAEPVGSLSGAGRGRGAGHGWSESEAGAGGGLSSITRIVSALPRVSGSWGSGYLLTGKLFSVLLTDSGKVVAGAVPPDLLYAALTGR